MNQPADIINIVIETLRQSKYELPSFKILSRLVKHTRERVNNSLFTRIEQQLSESEKNMLESLLINKYETKTEFNRLKQLPRKPTITHFIELIKHHHWLFSLIDIKPYLAEISQLKLQQFSAQAKSLDASNLKDFSPAKRHALILCLIQKAQREGKDALAVTFCRTLSNLHKRANKKLAELEEKLKSKTKKVVINFSEVLQECHEQKQSLATLNKIYVKLLAGGGIEQLQTECDQIIACYNKNVLGFLLEIYSHKRATLFHLLKCLQLQSATQNDSLIQAIQWIEKNESLKKEYVEAELDLSFTTQQWRRLIKKKIKQKTFHHLRYLEVCVFSHLAEELVSNDIFIQDAGNFADYRAELFEWDTCKEKIDAYCQLTNIPNNAQDLVKVLFKNLADTAQRVDTDYPKIDELLIEKERLILKKRTTKEMPKSALWLLNEIKNRMPERDLMDILSNTQHYSGWAEVFGPISGEEPKMDNPLERYILTNFAYGSGMGPTQAAKHIRSDVTAHTLSWINRRHITANSLDRAREKLINFTNTFPLLKVWGDGKAVAGDGNLREIREENLIAEFHMRYGRKGGIAYHHVANNYIALFSTFIPCGVWEAIAIIEGLLKNESELQPTTIHADTQGQSTIVFALAYLLGFKLMPRIRNLHDLLFFYPDKKTMYKNIDSLFRDPIQWHLIETHWKDMMQVVLSIKSGKISSSSLLRKLGSTSRKNKLYFALQELGRAIRTQFLLEYISDVELRESITETTNKVESYNALSEWTSFGSLKLTGSNDEEEMEKAIKYNDILTNSIILQNVIDITDILGQLKTEEYIISKDDIAFLSPYLTGHIKRFGIYYVDLSKIPRDPGESRFLELW